MDSNFYDFWYAGLVLLRDIHEWGYFWYDADMRQLLQKLFAVFFKSLAQVAMYRHQPTIVAITGNVGKTTTKDITMAILRVERTVGGTIRSQNSDLTTPMSILGLEVKSQERSTKVWLGLMVRGVKVALLSRTFPEILVLEVGAGGPGDITRQAQWLRPHISIFTALQANPVHLEYFRDRQELFDEKKQLAVYTRPGGTIVYNSDDEFLRGLLRDCPQHKISIGSRGDVSMKNIVNSAQGVSATVEVKGATHEIVIPGVWGESYVASFALGLAAAADLGLDISECATRAGGLFRPNPGRMRVLRGISGSTVVDDSYNASPKAVSAALDTLDQLSVPGRKILLFGDMKELGEAAESMHAQVGVSAAAVVDMLMLVGEEVIHTRAAALGAGMSEQDIVVFGDSTQAGEFIATMLRSGDIVLAKSSRHAIKMERALVQLVEPDHAQHLVQEYL